MTCRAAVRTDADRFRAQTDRVTLTAEESALCDYALIRVRRYLAWQATHPEQPYEEWPGRVKE